MSGDVQVRFCERLGVKFPWATHRNIYVRTERAGYRVMDRVTRFLATRLLLTVNASKSAVARPQERTFLGFTFTAGPTVARAIAPKAVRRFKTKVREITRRAKGVSLETTIAELAPYMRGWRNHFGFCETPVALVYLTRWVRLRLRAALWRQWRTPRRRRAALLALGVRPTLADHTAGSGRPPPLCRSSRQVLIDRGCSQIGRAEPL
jgi:RNA-directed DNA polymerase